MALQTGGALVMARNARIRVSNSAFEGNAAGSGGAIWAGDDRVDQASSLLVVGGNLQVDNSTFLGNSAAQAGGAAAFDVSAASTPGVPAAWMPRVSLAGIWNPR